MFLSALLTDYFYTFQKIKFFSKFHYYKLAYISPECYVEKNTAGTEQKLFISCTCDGISR